MMKQVSKPAKAGEVLKKEKAEPRKVVRKVFEREWLCPGAGDRYRVSELIADLTKQHAEAIAAGFDDLLMLGVIDDDSEWDTGADDVIYSLVGERLETDDEMTKRLAAEKQRRVNTKLARQKADKTEKVRQTKELVKLTQRLFESKLSDKEIIAALADACACKRSKAGCSPQQKP